MNPTSDTDSLTIAVTKSVKRERKINEKGEYDQCRGEMMSDVFLPMVKEELKSEFLLEWEKWLVLSNSIIDEKTPGI